jgi:hypothetical protein
MCTSRPAHRPRDDHRARLGYSLDQAGDPYQSEQVMHRPYVDLFVSAEQSGIQAVFRGKRTYVASPRRVDPTSIRVDLAEACPVRPAHPISRNRQSRREWTAQAAFVRFRWRVIL